MFANKLQINLNTLSATTGTTINIPFTMEFQSIDNSDIIKTLFVDTEVKKAINPIIDYEKIRCKPIDLADNLIDKIVYILNIDGSTNHTNG